MSTSLASCATSQKLQNSDMRTSLPVSEVSAMPIAARSLWRITARKAGRMRYHAPPRTPIQRWIHTHVKMTHQKCPSPTAWTVSAMRGMVQHTA
eukprot:CAMPEP_0178450884 /NCGR_PEP_ID=MMETSP0689_2-20121128/43370_1 /TAXON_ID=160604 /ORGANISM="Amphidinium massartii, Strain CS-259" /LENGTH=93 /DNA_ID=CAMNT_0020076395 /DNA_START=255 /DNA_END=536 /DNA_ORIENTATION=+